MVAGFAKLAEPLVEVNERCLGVGLELDSYILFRPMPGVTRNCRWSTGFLPGRFFGFDCCSKQHALPAVSQRVSQHCPEQNNEHQGPQNPSEESGLGAWGLALVRGTTCRFAVLLPGCNASQLLYRSGDCTGCPCCEKGGGGGSLMNGRK